MSTTPTKTQPTKASDASPVEEQDPPEGFPLYVIQIRANDGNLAVTDGLPILCSTPPFGEYEGSDRLPEQVRKPYEDMVKTMGKGKHPVESIKVLWMLRPGDDEPPHGMDPTLPFKCRGSSFVPYWGARD